MISLSKYFSRDKDIAAYLQSLSENQSGDANYKLLTNVAVIEYYVSEISSSNNLAEKRNFKQRQIPSIIGNKYDKQSAGGILWKSCFQSKSTPGRLDAHNV